MSATGPRVLPSVTRNGVGVTVGSLSLLALGWALGFSALATIGASGVVALAVGWVIAFVVPTLTVERTIQPTRVERGNPAFGLLDVTNPSTRRSRACEAIEPVVRRRRDDTIGERDTEIAAAVPSLRPGRTVSVPYRLPTNRRGALTVGPLEIERRDPLGLWHARRPIGRAVTLLVQPHVIPLDPRPTGRARHLDGPVSHQSTNGTQTFHSLREYTPGDDIRHVHWRSTARLGTMMVREHVDTSEPTTVIVIDRRAERFVGDGFEEAVDVVASVAAASQEHGFPVRVVSTAGHSVVVRSGQRGGELADFLTTVEAIDGDAAGNLDHAAVEVLRGREHDAITVVTGAVDAHDLVTVSSMTQRFSRPTLVTIRSDSGPTWRGGPHLDASTARDALRRWQLPVARTASAATARKVPG